MKIYLYLLFSLLVACQPTDPAPDTWPPSSPTAKPWTRWWWHGSSVTREGITHELEAYAEAGIGGVEITPIYGVIGEEQAFVDFLSTEWVENLIFTLEEADRLGLGVDMATGTGWPFGGPWVGEQTAAKYVAHQQWEVKGGERFARKVGYEQEPVVRDVFNRTVHLYDQMRENGQALTALPPEVDWAALNDRPRIEDLKSPISANENLQKLALDQVRFPVQLPLICLIAYGEQGQKVDLTASVGPEGEIDWTAPAGDWTLYALFQGGHGKMVERAAPGGEGLVIDHFSQMAIQEYLAKFDQALEGKDLASLRAFFNDSYEVDDARGQANWTPNLLETFQNNRGYDLKDYIPALLGEDSEENNQRVLSDFRETISELILTTFTQTWQQWAANQGKIVRNQAHGSPANILDLYAASDIPETEGTDIIRAKFATSAAHVSGKPLVSAEAATWLNEHFTSNLAHLKENVDRYFVSGVNHVVYHGTCYSPPGEPWPGRLFYAAIHANPRNPLWRHFPYFNQYVARTQAVLQSGTPANDVLLYFPMYDRFATPGSELLDHFDGHGPQLDTTQVKRLADFLLDQGYAFDFISDKQMLGLSSKDGKIQSGATTYQTLLIPQVNYMPLATLEKCIQLAESGTNVLIHHALPGSFPGMANQKERQTQWDQMWEALTWEDRGEGLQVAQVGKGRVVLSRNLETMLTLVQVAREKMVDLGLEFVRRKTADATWYFISNWSGKPVDHWVPLNGSGSQCLILDPETGEAGRAKTRNQSGKSEELLLQMPQGKSLIIKMSEGDASGEWGYYKKMGTPLPLMGTWKVNFLEGGPTLPAAYESEDVRFWTLQADPECLRFSGTARYSLTFSQPSVPAEAWLLEIGEVRDAATVFLNGQRMGTLMGPSWELVLPGDALEEENLLEIEVTNLMANRISDMDRDGVYWKKFYNINLSARLRENYGPAGVFDASQWAPMPSGLRGPVTLNQLGLKDH